MDPQKGGLLQNFLTGLFYTVLTVAYWILALLLRKQRETIIEPGHLQHPPSTPLSSLALAHALNPKTPQEKLLNLVADTDAFIRRAVVRNPGLPLSEVQKLTEDSDPLVASEARQILESRRAFAG